MQSNSLFNTNTGNLDLIYLSIQDYKIHPAFFDIIMKWYYSYNLFVKKLYLCNWERANRESRFIGSQTYGYLVASLEEYTH